MVHQCYFKHCKLAQTKHCKLRFHKFPSDEAVAEKWIQIIGRPPKFHSKICSKHFRKCDYKSNPRAIRPCLVPTAVPTKNLACHPTKGKKQKDRFDSDYEEDCSDDTMSFASSDGSEDHEDLTRDEENPEVATNRVICRACLRESDTANDFESLMTDMNVMYYTNLTLIDVYKEDSGSKLICSKCLLLLAKFHSFKETCLKSNQYFIDQELQQSEDAKSTVKLEISIQNTESGGEFVACDYDTAEIEMHQANIDFTIELQESPKKTEDATEDSQCKDLETVRVRSKPPLRNKKRPLDTGEKKVKYKKILEENGFIQCPYCPKQFSKINTFYKHKRDHLHTYMCTLCGKQYASQRSLTIHFQFIHTDERRFKCDLCGQAFKAKATLIDHLERHSNSRNYVCDRCSSAFKSKKSLDAHVRLVHSNLEAKFECSHCDKKFKKKSYLVTHEQLHSGHKLFTCQLCEKSFTTKNSRDRHLERHSSSEHRPYQCRLCFNTFKRSKYHNRHLKKIHPDEPELPAIRLPHQIAGLNNKNYDDTEKPDEELLVVKTETDIQL